jgi:hypothetical protein
MAQQNLGTLDARSFAECTRTPADRKPVTVNFQSTPSDITGTRREFNFSEAVPAGVLRKALIDKSFCLKLAGTICSKFCAEILVSESWVCSAGEECRKPATKFIMTPMSYLHKSPPCVVDVLPVPVCGDPMCSTVAAQQTKDLLKSVSDEIGVEKGQTSALYSAKARVCLNCNKDDTCEARLLTCSRCKVAYFCDKECQKLAWAAGHKKACVKKEVSQFKEQRAAK